MPAHVQWSPTLAKNARGEKSVLARLIILSASYRRAENPEPIPALERYRGVYFRVVKKYLREGLLKNTDILIVSDKFGILSSNDRVPYHKPFKGQLGKEEVSSTNEKNLTKLAEIFERNHYSEIFVVCGQEFRKLINGFENLTDTKITFCKGSTLGSKAQDLRRWILIRTR